MEQGGLNQTEPKEMLIDRPEVKEQKPPGETKKSKIKVYWGNVRRAQFSTLVVVFQQNESRVLGGGRIVPRGSQMCKITESHL